MTYAIQTISSHALRAAGDADAEWGTVEPQSGVDYSSHRSVLECVTLLEQDEPGKYAYQVVEVATAEQSYAELEAENLDALEALSAWVDAGCPRHGTELHAVEKAALYRAKAVPVKVVAATGKGRAA